MQRFILAAMAALALALLASPAAPVRAAVALDEATFYGAVVPYLQALADGNEPAPGLSIADGRVVPTGGEWEAPGEVKVVDIGDGFDVDADVADVSIHLAIRGDGER